MSHMNMESRTRAMAVLTVIGIARVDLLASGIYELPDRRGDEFEERACPAPAPNVTIGGKGGNCACVLRRLGIAAAGLAHGG